MTKALLIVDVQKGFITDCCANLPQIVEDLQHKFDHVLVPRFINPAASPWRKIMDWHECGEGTPEAELAFTPRPDAEIITRTHYAIDMELIAPWLNERGVRDVYLCGVDTHACVLMNAVKLFESNQFVPWVLGDACASHNGKDMHAAGLKTLEGLIGHKQIISLKSLKTP